MVAIRKCIPILDKLFSIKLTKNKKHLFKKMLVWKEIIKNINLNLKDQTVNYNLLLRSWNKRKVKLDNFKSI